MSANEVSGRAPISGEAAYRDLVDAAPDAIFLADPDGRFTYVNAAACRLVGYASEELVGRPISDLIVPEAAGRQTALQNHTSERELRRRDGSNVRVELRSNALPDGRLQGFIREARRALQGVEAKFSAMVAGASDGIVTVDEKRRIMSFNEGAEALFGYAAADVIGAPLEILLPERFRNRHREHVESFAAGDQPSRRMGGRYLEVLGRKKTGEEFSVDASISKLDLGHERLLAVILRDVSDRKLTERAERLLAEIGHLLVSAGADSERLLEDVAHAVVHEVADWCSFDVVNESGVQRFKLVHADPSMAQTCKALERYSIGERSPVTHVAEKQNSMLVSDVTPEHLEGIAQDEEHLRLMRLLDAGSFIVVPLVARGQTIGTFGIGAARASRRFDARDLSLAERIASRLALAVDNARLYRSLERAMNAREEVLGIVAHDLRSPLNAITVGLQILGRTESAAQDDLARDARTRITRSVRRMSALIDDLLDVTRLEAGERLSITGESLAPSRLLAEIVDQAQAAHSNSGQTIRLELEGDVPAIWGDARRLNQVFDNLIGNATRVARRLVAVGGRGRHDHVLFWVRDDGNGISADEVPRLFDRFWQGASRGRSGSGLGLSIVKGIVEAHGGRVWVESQVGSGTTFYFTVPVASGRG